MHPPKPARDQVHGDASCLQACDRFRDALRMAQQGCHPSQWKRAKKAATLLRGSAQKPAGPGQDQSALSSRLLAEQP
jgi:hypothetical protein